MGYIFTKPLHFIILSLLLCQLSRAQLRVSGNISSAQGDPLPGATVTLTGKSLTTLSDEKGNYSIEAQEGDSLEFSMSGFESAVRKVSDSNVINVKLPAQKTQELQEVVVNAAYRKIKAQEFTGTLNEVKKETIARNSGSSAQSALENAPWVIVNQSSGQAGSGFNVRVRGVASVNGSQDPLYVIDGVPVASGDFSTSTASSSNVTSLINPEDI